ncbi:MAG TPA: DUF4157 domain-containing protein [Kofleriaceae bacterium]
MNHEHEQHREGSPGAATTQDDTVEPGRSSRSALLRKPTHPVASGMVQRKMSGARDALATVAPRVKSQTGLSDDLKAGIESLSGISMDNVKVHYDSSRPAQLDAFAYAQGSDIHVAPGQEKHVPHEAWHIVQKAQGRVQSTTQLKNGVAANEDEGLEAEADVMGAKAISVGAETDHWGHALSHEVQQNEGRVSVTTQAEGAAVNGAPSLEREADELEVRAGCGEQVRDADDASHAPLRRPTQAAHGSSSHVVSGGIGPVQRAKDESNIKSEITVGNITSSNPALWVKLDTPNGKPEFKIATNTPDGFTTSVNQFCSILSVEWLKGGGKASPYGIENFTDPKKILMAQTLIGYKSMDDQIEYAKTQLNGKLQLLKNVEDGVQNHKYAVDTKIWAGNDRHVVAIYIMSNDYYKLYDSNDGSTKELSRIGFGAKMGGLGCNSFVVAGLESKDGCCQIL